jgi:alpha-amylase
LVLKSLARRRTWWVAAAVVLASCGGGASEGPPARPDLRGGTVYEIFVRSFADSNGDGIGDLKGLTAKLDVLNDGDPQSTTSLGIEAIWLMPLHPSPSYHGYDVTDYLAINPQYGTMADFDEFLAAAKQRGIAVLLDMVVNHTSTQHPWFVSASSGAAAERRDFYMWRDTQPIWSRPWDAANPWYARGDAYYYGLFCGCMPDLNLGNPAVEAELFAAMTFWLDRGVDGFRLDAVRYLFESSSGALADQPENHAFLKRMRAHVDQARPGSLLVAEAWGPLAIQARYWGQGDQVHLAFSFDLAEALKEAARTGNAATLINHLARSEATFADKDRAFEAPFLSNHDQPRVLRELGGDAGAARVAAAALFAMPGTPFIYYGEELGMRGGAAANDEHKRTPFRWTAEAPGHGFSDATPWFRGDEAAGVDVATQQADPTSLWHHYRKLIGLRRAQRALHAGDATRPAVTGGGEGLVVLLRTAPTGERVLFVANFDSAESGGFTVEVAGAARVLHAEGALGAPSASSGKLTFPSLAARGFAFVALT